LSWALQSQGSAHSVSQFIVVTCSYKVLFLPRLLDPLRTGVEWALLPCGGLREIVASLLVSLLLGLEGLGVLVILGLGLLRLLVVDRIRSRPGTGRHVGCCFGFWLFRGGTFTGVCSYRCLVLSLAYAPFANDLILHSGIHVFASLSYFHERTLLSHCMLLPATIDADSLLISVTEI